MIKVNLQLFAHKKGMGSAAALPCSTTARS